MQSIAARRLNLGLGLFEREDWDLFWLVFTFTDRFQHYMWKYMDPNHPMHDPISGPVYGVWIENAYVMADNYLAEFIRRMQPDDLLIVMSDHGFGHLYYTINAKNFLQRTLGGTDNVACTDFFGAKFRIGVSGPGAEERFLSIRNRLVEGLRALEDPVSGTRVADSVYIKEDLYTGPYVSGAPDIVCIEKPGYLFFTLPSTSDLRLLDSGPAPDKAFSGFHRRRGSIGLFGANVVPGQRIEARITDVAAMIMGYLGVPAPAETDGKTHGEFFLKEASDRFQIARTGDQGYRRPTGLKTQDTQKIEKQLRAVGYIQ